MSADRFVIDRNIWNRGYKLNTECQLKNVDEQSYCCLGIYLNSCGISDESLEDRLMPEDLVKESNIDPDLIPDWMIHSYNDYDECDCYEEEEHSDCDLETLVWCNNDDVELLARLNDTKHLTAADRLYQQRIGHIPYSKECDRSKLDENGVTKNCEICNSPIDESIREELIKEIFAKNGVTVEFIN